MQSAYELQNQNIEQLKNNNEALNENNSLLRDKISSLEKSNISLEERIKLFKEGLLPQAKQNLTATLSHYQVGHIDFINVIDAQDQLFKIETNVYRLKTNYLKQISELEFLVGKTLRN